MTPTGFYLKTQARTALSPGGNGLTFPSGFFTDLYLRLIALISVPLIFDSQSRIHQHFNCTPGIATLLL